MILQALKEYYDRKPDLPRCGWEFKEIPFLVLLDKKGDFVGFKDTRESIGKKLRAKSFLVPSLGEKKGNGIKSNLFWKILNTCLASQCRQSQRKILMRSV